MMIKILKLLTRSFSEHITAGARRPGEAAKSQPDASDWHDVSRSHRLMLSLAICLAWTSFQDLLAQVPLETDSVEKNYAAELTRTPALSPDEALKAFQIRPGFRIELAASEPQVTDPVAMAFDELGRLFVVEMRDYSEQPDDRLGQVRMLLDRDQDGHFESSTIYASGLSWPTAITCFADGVIVGCPPDILFLKDGDDDGVAEQRATWFTGFGRQNVQGMMNSFAWGIDGRLYGTSSSNGGTIRNLLGEQGEVDLRRRDFAIRFGPQPTIVAVSGGGQHGLSFDAAGNRFVSSNSNHLQWVRLEARYLSRNPYLEPVSTTDNIAADGPAAEVFRSSPVEPWREVRTRLRVKGLVGGPVEGGGRAAGYFTGASGVTIYTGDAFPEDFQQRTHAFVGDVGGNLVHHKVIETDGLVKTARRVEQDAEFLTSTDNWFRPVQFANGPDGCLYVLDMYRETIEHPLSLPPMIKKHLDLTSGRDRGRIYRIVPEKHRWEKRELPGQAATARRLVQMLGHANGWHRETAMRLLIHDQNRLAEVTKALRTAVARPANEQQLVRSLYCLKALDALEADRVRAFVSHDSWWVRKQILRMAEDIRPFPINDEQIAALASDSDIRVRLQLAFSLGELPTSWEIEPHLMELAKADLQKHEPLRWAILSSLDGRWAAMARMLLKQGDSAALTDEVLRQAGQSNQNVAEIMGEIWASQSERKFHWMAELLSGIGLRGDKLAAYLRRSDMAALDLPEDVLSQIVQSATSIAESNRPTVERIQAVDHLRLAEFSSITTTLKALLAPRQPETLREAAVEVIASYGDLAAAKLLLDVEQALGGSARRRVFDLLCSRAAWASELLKAIGSGRVAPTSISAQHRQQLLSHQVRSIRSGARRLFGDSVDRRQVVERFRVVLGMSGDLEQGQKVFTKLCSSCHRLDEHGYEVGPDLHPLKNRGAEFFLTNILDPNREVDQRYVGYALVDEGGQTHSGIVLSQDDHVIQLKAAEAKIVAINRDKIEEFRTTGVSLMPEGLEKDLNPQSLADLIAYLIGREP